VKFGEAGIARKYFSEFLVQKLNAICLEKIGLNLGVYNLFLFEDWEQIQF
jgi:hypothetical protein